ncbi:uncharacterized protein LOC100679406 [Nasonia vitripennis]|uniref:Uncharacterized protein n=1 Tax=Nasonia vitripennis TaxID=7425 RepID=A0A7M7GDK8_NASVI|nr:uncharacterized protein LOC100679406 [Nasonia vitripennis]
MALRYFSIIFSFLLVLNAYQLQVNALLEETTVLAIDTSEKFISELEKKTTYTDVKDLIDALKRLTQLYCESISKWDKNYLFFYTSFIDLKPIFARDEDDIVGVHFGNKGCSYTENVFNETELAIDKSGESSISQFAYKILRIVSIREHDYDSERQSVWGNALNKMHKFLTTAENNGGESPLDSMTNEKKVAQCIENTSWQALLFEHLRWITRIDAFAYTKMQFTYASYEMLSRAHDLIQEKHLIEFKKESATWKEKNIIKKMKALEGEFRERNTITTNAFKDRMNVPRDYRNCLVEDEARRMHPNYAKRNPYAAIQVFQKYVINEADINSIGSCKEDCPYYEKSQVFGCFDQSGICAKQRQCVGNVWNCRKMNGSAADICLTNQENSWERYGYIEISGKSYGDSRNAYCTSVVRAEHQRRFLYKCDYCICTCESKKSDYNKYVNLRPVVSDTDSNHVVTDARFQIHNHVVHIQIKQGKLVENGHIEKWDAWKPVDNYTTLTHPYKDYGERVIAGKDYHTVSYNDSAMCLDELDSPNSSHVLTGLRLKSESEDNLYLKLEIRLTPFDYKTGLLSDKESYWHSNNAKLRDRGQVNLKKLEATNLKSERYFRFTASPLEVDAGQTTIPYIATTEMSSTILPSLPKLLSGAGLFLAKDYTLAIKGLTYDYGSRV